MHEIEVFIMIDENGDYAICKERSELQEAYDNDIGDSEAAKRIIAVKLNVPSPAAIEITANVPAEPSQATVAVN